MLLEIYFERPLTQPASSDSLLKMDGKAHKNCQIEKNAKKKNYI